MNLDDVKTRKDIMIYLLLELNKINKPVSFGNFFFDSGYALGIDSFRDVLDEMHLKGWLTKQENPSGSVPGMPFLRTVDLKYGISLDGFEYLVSLGLIEDKFKIDKMKDDNAQNSSIVITGDKNQISVEQSSSSNKINTTKAPKTAANTIKKILIGLFVTIIGGLILYLLTKK
jgi:hypothetical protein